MEERAPRAELFVEDGFKISSREGYRRALLMMKLAFVAGHHAAAVTFGIEPEDEGSDYLAFPSYDPAKREMCVMTQALHQWVGVGGVVEEELNELELGLTQDEPERQLYVGPKYLGDGKWEFPPAR